MADTSSWLNITSSDTAMGSVSFFPDPSEASDGDEITVSASPASGYHFAGWSDTGSVDNPRTITAGTAITAKAVFVSESNEAFPSVNIVPKPWWMSALYNYLKSFLSVASGASKINTQDKGNHFNSNSVEGQLQELGATTEATDLVINTPATLLSKLPAQLTGKTADYSDVAHDIDDDTITTSKITDLNVTTPKLANDAVVNSKIADNAVQTENIVDGNVTTNKLADDAVVNSKVADDAIQTENIVDSNVTTAKIADKNVTTAKLDDDAVTNAKIADDAIQTENIVDGNITTDKLDDDCVVNSKIADDAIQTENIVDSNVTTAKIADKNVTTAKLDDDAVVNSKIADNAVQTENIVDSNVTTAKLANLSVTTAKLDDDAVVNSKVADDAIQTENIVDKNITTAKLDDDCVVNSKVADDAIQTENIVDSNVTTPKIADENVTNIKLSDTAIKSRTVTGTTDGTDYSTSGFQYDLDGTGTLSMTHLRTALDGKMFYSGCAEFNGYVINPYITDFTTPVSNKYILIPVRPAGTYSGCFLYQLDFWVNSMVFSVAATSEDNEWGNTIGKSGSFIRAHGILDNSLTVRFLNNDGALYIEVGVEMLGNFFEDTEFVVHIVGYNPNVSPESLASISASSSKSTYTENMSRIVRNGGADMVTASLGLPNPSINTNGNGTPSSSVMGYRLWSSGLKEQWGWLNPGSQSTRTVSLSVPYGNDHSYVILMGKLMSSGNSGSTGRMYPFVSQTASSFQIRSNTDVASFWYTIGY